MLAGALRPYERALLDGGVLHLWSTRAGRERLDTSRWLARADLADLSVVARCSGSVLDVGCGPGRMLAALAGRGLPATGIDISKTAVRLARRRGGSAQRRDVFGPVPAAGNYATVLLLDGNIGIGGDPARLLARCAELTRPDGRVLVEAHCDDGVDEIIWARFSRSGAPFGPQFPWARVGRVALAGYAAATGWRCAGTWTVGERVFSDLRRVAAP